MGPTPAWVARGTVVLPFGEVEVEVRGGVLVAVRFVETPGGVRGAERAGGKATSGGRRGGEDAAVLAEAARQLAEYGEGRRASFDLPLAPARTPFAAAVRARLGEVGLGETVTYGRLAAAVGAPRGARAVGAAMAANPLPVVVPCHRVVGAGGKLGGYAGGSERKAAILEHEARLVAAAGAPAGLRLVGPR